MSQSIPLSDLQGGASAKFERQGDKYAGRVTSIEQRHQTDPKTGQVQTWADGTPKPVVVISLEQSNGEVVALWAKGGRFSAATGQGESMLNAIGTAVRAAGAASLDVGAQLAVAYTGEGEAKPGLNAPKLYSAQYQAAPAASVAVDDLFAS